MTAFQSDPYTTPCTLQSLHPDYLPPDLTAWGSPFAGRSLCRVSGTVRNYARKGFAGSGRMSAFSTLLSRRRYIVEKNGEYRQTLLFLVKSAAAIFLLTPYQEKRFAFSEINRYYKTIPIKKGTIAFELPDLRRCYDAAAAV